MRYILESKKRISNYEEWSLDAIYLISVFIYIIIQWQEKNAIADLLFLLLLTFATLFLNKRQKELYISLSENNGKKFLII